MHKIILAAAAVATLTFSAPAEAAHRHYQPTAQAGYQITCYSGDRVADCGSQARYSPNRAYSHRAERRRTRLDSQQVRITHWQASYGEATIIPHPQGCPSRAFCACGAAVRVFGSPIRSLWPSSAWFKFPRTSPASGMVAVRHGHVFVLESHVGGSEWLITDYNSGGHLSRRHVRSISGYTIVNPHGIKMARLQ